jgi:acyl carrier protein
MSLETLEITVNVEEQIKIEFDFETGLSGWVFKIIDWFTAH